MKCVCGKPLPTGRKYCSHECQGAVMTEEAFARVEAGISTSASAIRNYMKSKHSACSTCGLSEWNGSPITLEVDHIDGDSSNNTLVNLRLLCPNCHSQTETYRNKNKGNGRHNRRERYKSGQSY